MTTTAFTPDTMLQQLSALRHAARRLRATTSEARNTTLQMAADLLEQRVDDILAANHDDIAALPGSADSAFRDRLLLTPARVSHMAVSLRQVAALPDPVGEVVDRQTLANGLAVRRVRSPLGVILMIFESRPNVAVEAFSLGFKAGNTMILRGGKESARTTAVLYAVLGEALTAAGVGADCLWGIANPDRGIVEFLLGQKRWIDVVVPRGGDALIDYVSRTSSIPVIKNDRGMCHVYVHHDADLAMAEAIVLNAKTQRPGVCNAMETLLVHQQVASALLPALQVRMPQVQWQGCERSLALLTPDAARVSAATTASWDTEHLSLVLNSRVVDSLDDAIAHIEMHGSRHSESIITASAEAAHRFQQEIDAAAVYWNASTRFTDGFELGLGGELGISTQKLHVRGPVGLRELTSVRWLMDGTGQTRG
ncbi:gamma-glutamyl phosphate reductase [Gemmatimonas aurantiaca T-27]|uniref:Gamma-glutamyl phosphate reductase n=2 Tax=Gemmatimonas aurantiaca TaxID=173480 RepID=C1ACS3_GEMAT|nr:glutamate-5-semialdehyde dehydrogenase [Gemmatimonas aurantiaca]BAH40300.1 gamma-glutamyl phosphate reductase [Gemmatimonas aurantiaca T-27]